MVYDFDGVMTDNKVYIDQHGNEMVQVSRADGLGISEIRKLAIEQIILSTETNPVVAARAKKLDLFCIQCVDNKAQTLTDYCKSFYTHHQRDDNTRHTNGQNPFMDRRCYMHYQTRRF